MSVGIYIHFPFCKQKCIYCNFFSVVSSSLKNEYWDCLCKEIELRKDYLPQKQINTIYFGGGTPTLCTPDELARIAQQLTHFYTLSPDYEWTIEANPEQLTLPYLKELHSLGINRLSIGVQSFNDKILQLLNRKHTGQQALDAVKNAEKAGFENISIDLIYDIAFRDENMWRDDLGKAIHLPIKHLSAYSLTIEENTILAKQIAKGKNFVTDEELTERDYALLIEYATKGGFEQYEISNFARNNAISKHNSSYWLGSPYMGLGAAAHSFVGHTRQWNIANIQQYINGIRMGKPNIEKEELSITQQYNEYVLLRLRTKFGIILEELSQQFGTGYQNHFQKHLQKIKPEYIEWHHHTLTLSQQGRLFADAIALELFKEE